jgi:hypothetical protein
MARPGDVAVPGVDDITSTAGPNDPDGERRAACNLRALSGQAAVNVPAGFAARATTWGAKFATGANGWGAPKDPPGCLVAALTAQSMPPDGQSPHSATAVPFPSTPTFAAAGTRPGSDNVSNPESGTPAALSERASTA